MYYNQSSFYRANPFYRQGYVMDGALKNRKPVEHLVELPQGDNHFDNSRRKQFTNILKKSEIYENKLFEMPEEINRGSLIAIDKKYPRNLQTQDIEGAIAGSYKSRVVRNREKAGNMSLDVKKELYFNPNNKEHFEEFMKSYKEDEVKKELEYRQLRQNKELLDLMTNRGNYHLMQKKNQQSGQMMGKQKLEQIKYQVPQESQRNDKRIEAPISRRNSEEYKSAIQHLPALELPTISNREEYKEEHVHSNRNLSNNAVNLQHNQQRTLDVHEDKNTIHSERQQHLPTNRSDSLEFGTINTDRIKNRKLNPTYLSFGSPSVNPFNNAAKNMMMPM